jgi:uncharacterized membrane protein
MTTQTNPDKAETFKEFWQRLSPGIRIGYPLGAALCITCIWVAFRMPPADEWWLNLLLCLFGLVLGWSVGVLLSPMTKIEETRFTSYGKALSAFVTGFVVAKLEFLLKDFSFAHTNREVFIGRILLFAATLITGFQFTFMARLTTPPDEKPKAKT